MASSEKSTPSTPSYAGYNPNRPGHFCWMELMTGDRERAAAFYRDLCGWEVGHREMNSPMPDCPSFTYTMAGPAGAAYKVAGMMQMDGPQWQGVPPHWMAYISVEDVDAKARQASELGGQVVVPPTDIPQVGRFAIIKDPTGAAVSLITLAGG